MADQFSFDVVSQVDMQEMKNVVDQATKEVKQRFDFKDSKTEITLKEKEKELVVVSDDEYKLNAVNEIIKAKCVKRHVSLKALDYGKVEDALGATVRHLIGEGERNYEIDQGFQVQGPSANSGGAAARAEQKQG
jgi:hypothetical protein